MTERILKVGFIGAGAIGTLFGGYIAISRLEDFNIKVILFARSEHANQINNKGLILQKDDNEIIQIKNIEVFESFFSFKKDYQSVEDDYFDFLFISTKAYDTLRAVQEYKQLVKSSRWVLILQNGIGNEDLIKNELKGGKLVRIVTSHGALLKEPGYVIHTGVGFTKIGALYAEKSSKEKHGVKHDQRSLNLLKNILDHVKIETELVNNINYYCWEKAFVNIGINPIGAITRLTNGQLIKWDYLKKIMIDVIEEALQVAESEGFSFQKDNIIKIMFDVAESTATNENSMLQDIKSGRPTEINFLNGKIVDIAQNQGINVPINQFLTNLVRGLEYSYLNRD